MEANGSVTKGVSTGLALGVTVGVGYAACALVFRLWPEAGAAFMNSLFHGLDFRKLQAGGALFDFGTFSSPLPCWWRGRSRSDSYSAGSPSVSAANRELRRHHD